MLEDKYLVWRFQRGSREALQRIYQKYKDDLLALALALGPDRAAAEDVVHDVFVSLAERAGKLQIRGSLKGYLCSSVANRIRNRAKAKGERIVSAVDMEMAVGMRPEELAMTTEQAECIGRALGQLPYEQREVMMLHLHGEMGFRGIAEIQGVSINTVQSRYRYGLDKLRTILNGELNDETK